jgi:AraC family transcriptional regulator, L-arginine-responsive activator
MMLAEKIKVLPCDERFSPTAHALALRVALVHVSDGCPFELSLLEHVFRLAGGLVPRGAVELTMGKLETMDASRSFDLVVLAEHPHDRPGQYAAMRVLRSLIDGAPSVVLLAGAAAWFASTPWAHGLRVALHWNALADVDGACGSVIAVPTLYETAGKWTSCCGGAATLDLSIELLRRTMGARVAGRVQEQLCMDRLRHSAVRQRPDKPNQIGALPPVLTEAALLMDANTEDPLGTDEIARLLGVTRRQLERLFKQYLSKTPARYYLDLRLAHARRLLRETTYSMLEVGVMCGFSSGSHFATRYADAFGLAPRDERQQVLQTLAASVAVRHTVRLSA